jgi:hypothetical protein
LGRKPSRKLEINHFPIVADDWDCFYSFGVARSSKHIRNRYPVHYEKESITIIDHAYKGEKFFKIKKDTKFEVTIYPEEEINDYIKAGSIGSIRYKPNPHHVYITVPYTSLNFV